MKKIAIVGNQSKGMFTQMAALAALLFTERNFISKRSTVLKPFKRSHKRHQGEQEKARRRRQIAQGRIPEEQILHLGGLKL